jgi:threonylcarbamoyladenosine tRNA methylthiotransferase CDKAL1
MSQTAPQFTEGLIASMEHDKPKVAFQVYGCTMNQADATVAMGFIQSKGLRVTSEEDANTVIVFSCAVRNETEEKVISNVKRLQKKGKKVIITSCLANSRPAKLLAETPSSVLLIGGDNSELMNAISSSAGTVVYGKTRLEARPTDRPIYPIKISQGCTSNCSFCITKLARPSLWCRPSDEIVSSIQKSVLNGAIEIDLSSMDNADYFEPPKTRLPELVKKIVNNVRGDYAIRIGMMNPKGALLLIEGLVDVLHSNKVYKFLHIPIQSGDARVVKDMNRDYDPQRVAFALEKLKRDFPSLRIATDIMVGYPTEDDEAFESTLKLIESGVFDKIHMFRFTPRPHTKASFVKQLDEPIKKHRSEVVSRLITEVQRKKNQEYLGTIQEALVTDAVGNERLEARLNNYLKIYLPYKASLLRSRLQIEIHQFTPEHLIGKILKV